jgi:hypothetical protein
MEEPPPQPSVISVQQRGRQRAMIESFLIGREFPFEGPLRATVYTRYPRDGIADTRWPRSEKWVARTAI